MPPEYNHKNLDDNTQFLCQGGWFAQVNKLNLDGSPKRDLLQSYYTNSTTNVPIEILNTGNVDVLNKYLNNHGGDLTEREKKHLRERIDVMNYFNALEQHYREHKRKSVGPMQPNSSGQMVLPGVFLDRKQDTSLGCWSCALSMLFKGRGVNIDQKLIRRYRPEFVEGNEPISAQQTDITNSNMMSEVYQYSSLVDKVCPNTKMCKMDRGGTAITEDQIRNAVFTALREKNAPVAYCNGGHWTTIVGMNELTGTFYVVNSEYTQAGYIEEVPMYRYLSNPRAQFVWMEDIVLEKDGTSKQLPDSTYTFDQNSGAVIPKTGELVVEGGTDMSTRGIHLVDWSTNVESYVPSMIRDYSKSYQQQKAESDEYKRVHNAENIVRPKAPKYTPVQANNQQAVEEKLQRDAVTNMITDRKAFLRDKKAYTQAQADSVSDEVANRDFDEYVKNHPGVLNINNRQVRGNQGNQGYKAPSSGWTNAQRFGNQFPSSGNTNTQSLGNQQIKTEDKVKFLLQNGFSKEEIDSMDTEMLADTYSTIIMSMVPEENVISLDDFLDDDFGFTMFEDMIQPTPISQDILQSMLKGQPQTETKIEPQTQTKINPNTAPQPEKKINPQTETKIDPQLDDDNYSILGGDDFWQFTDKDLEAPEDPKLDTPEKTGLQKNDDDNYTLFNDDKQGLEKKNAPEKEKAPSKQEDDKYTLFDDDVKAPAKQDDAIDFKALGITEEEYLNSLQQEALFESNKKEVPSKETRLEDFGGIKLTEEEMLYNLNAFDQKQPEKQIDKQPEKDQELGPQINTGKEKQPEKEPELKIKEESKPKAKEEPKPQPQDFRQILTALKSVTNDKLMKAPGKASPEYIEMASFVNKFVDTVDYLQQSSSIAYNAEDFAKDLKKAADKAQAFKESCFAKGANSIKGKTLDQFTLADSIIRINDMAEKGATDPTAEMKKLMATKVVVMSMGYDAADLEPEELDAQADKLLHSVAFGKLFGKDDFATLNKKATLNEDAFNKMIQNETKAYKKSLESNVKNQSGPSMFK